MHDEFAEWYVEWAKEYLRLFGIATNENLTTLTLWGRSFCAMQFTYGEMKLAEAIVRNLPKETAPARVGDHYYAIKSAVTSSREMTRQKIETTVSADDKGRCSDCGESGFIIVPHPKFCTAMEWRPNGNSRHGDPIFPTAAVLCRCWKGRKFDERQAQDRLDGKTVCMPVTTYEETVNANWRNQMRERAEQRRIVANVESSMGAAA
jgi:hypothetical protein